MKRLSLSNLRFVLFLIILAAIISVMGLTLQTGLDHRQMASDAVSGRALALAEHAADDEIGLINGARQFLLGLASLPSLRQGEAPCREALTGLLKQAPNYSTIAVGGRRNHRAKMLRGYPSSN